MNLRVLSTLTVIAGVTIAAFAGAAISRRAGFFDSSWLMLAFAFGVLLVSQGPVLKLEQKVRDLQRKLEASGRA